MSSGRTHAKVATFAFAGMACSVAAASIYLPATPVSLIASAGLLTGGFVGILVTPDADQTVRTREDNRIYRHLGWLGGKSWELYWRGYARRYSHRGVSHAPIKGTATRWAYVIRRGGFIPLLALAWLGVMLGSDFFIAFGLFAVTAFVGNVLQDILHLAFDGFRWYE